MKHYTQTFNKTKTFNNMKKVTLAAVALIAVGCISFEACKKEDKTEIKKEQQVAFQNGTKTLNYDFEFRHTSENQTPVDLFSLIGTDYFWGFAYPNSGPYPLSLYLTDENPINFAIESPNEVRILFEELSNIPVHVSMVNFVQMGDSLCFDIKIDNTIYDHLCITIPDSANMPFSVGIFASDTKQVSGWKPPIKEALKVIKHHVFNNPVIEYAKQVADNSTKVKLACIESMKENAKECSAKGLCVQYHHNLFHLFCTFECISCNSNGNN